MRILRFAPLLLALAAVTPAFGQAFTGPATITQPTTPGDCVKIDTNAQRTTNLIDAGAPCGAGSGGVSSFNTRTGAVVSATNDYSFSQISGVAGSTQGGAGSVTVVLAGDGSGNVSQGASTGLSDSVALARLASPTFTGSPAAPTPSTGDNSTLLATTAFVKAQSYSTATGANPTATIGASAVNGTSSNFMRADGAPALPATLPALSGVNLTALNGSNVASGTVADARLSANVSLKNASNVFTSMQIFNLNTAGAPTPITGAVVQIVGADAANGFVENDTFGATPIFTGRRADGTGASPSAVQSTEALAGFSARPYDGTGYTSASTGNVQAVASENFSGTSHGTDLVGNCTAITTTTTVECWRAKSNGFTIPTGSTYQINGAQIAASNLSNGTSGSGSVCLTTNCAMTTPNLGTPSAATLTSATGLPISTGVSGLGTGVATLLGGASSGTGGPAGTAGTTFTGTTAVAALTASGTIQTANGGGFVIASIGRIRAGAADGSFQFTNSSTTNNVALRVIANATLQLGDIDVDTSPVAQTFRSQGALAGGTSNVAGANWTFIASPGKGTGKGGSFLLQTTAAGSTGTVVGTPVTTLSVDAVSGVLIPASFPLTMGKATDPGTAPGAGFCKEYWIAGTNSGTGKKIAYCGTSTTPVTIVDNVGGGF